jgi:hypothetical protein
MNCNSRKILITAIALGSLALAGCTSTDTTREAASVGALPKCDDGLASECVVSVPTEVTTVVKNGSTVAFAEQNMPVTQIVVDQICWSNESDVDATNCASDETQLPEWVNIQLTNVQSVGKSWPALSIQVLETPDTNGDLFVPLPATIALSVTGASGSSTVNLEVACCDQVTGSIGSAVQGSSKAEYITLDNELTLADGTPVTITWRVSNTESKFWDGTGRPDNKPPQGLQGLVQTSGSGAYKVRTEVATDLFYDNPNFILTPIVEVGGQQISLEPWRLTSLGGEWQLFFGGPNLNDNIDACLTTPSFSTPTPKGELRYQITGKCADPTSSFVITSPSL